MLESTKQLAQPTTPKKYYFRCTSNPKGPLLVLYSYWEAEEMKTHPDYVRVTEVDTPIPSEADEAPHPLPFHANPPAAKRPILGLPKKGK